VGVRRGMPICFRASVAWQELGGSWESSSQGWFGLRYIGTTVCRAQTERLGAVGPVRGLPGGTTSLTALFRGLTLLRGQRDSGGRSRPSPSFQKSAAGLSSIRSRVVSERRTAVSRSRRKSQKGSTRGIPFGGARSDSAGLFSQLSAFSGSPRRGDR